MSSHAIVITAACVIAAVVAYHLYCYNIHLHSVPSLDALINKTQLHDTLYFKTTDIFGKESAIHDSGIKPSTLKSQDKILLNTVKYEYVDGIETILDRPVEIAIGQNIYNLATHIKLDSHKIQEKKGYYSIVIDNLWK